MFSLKKLKSSLFKGMILSSFIFVLLSGENVKAEGNSESIITNVTVSGTGTNTFSNNNSSLTITANSWNYTDENTLNLEISASGNVIKNVQAYFSDEEYNENNLKSINGLTLTSTTQSVSYSVPISSTGYNGTYYYYVKVTTETKYELWKIEFKYDHIAPEISSCEYEYDDNGTATVYVNASDTLSGIKGYAITTSKETPTSWEESTNSTYEFTKVEPGNTYYIYVIDNVGNTSYKTVKVDKDINNTDITIDDIEYDGNDHSNIDITVKDGNNTLTKGVDYSYELNTADMKNIGEKNITITGIGNYEGTAQKTFNITKKSIESSDITFSSNSISLNYIGENQYESAINRIIIKYNGDTLKENTDYTLSPSTTDMTSVGTYTITVSGAGNFSGSKEITVTIKGTSITNAEITFNSINYGDTVDENVIKSVKIDEVELIKDTDYEIKDITYNESEGKYYIKISGIGNYSGEKTQSVSENATDLSETTMTLSSYEAEYTGYDITPTVKIVYNGKTVSSSYYSVSYENNINKGTATVTVTGTGTRFTGSISDTFAIVAKSISVENEDGTQSISSYFSVTGLEESYSYTGEEVIPEIKLLYIGEELVKGEDYTLSYTNNIERSEGENLATIEITGIGNYTGSFTLTFSIGSNPINNYTVSGISESYEYTGEDVIPEFTVTATDGTVLTKDIDYTITYEGNNGIGTCDYTIVGIDIYSGYIKGSFDIVYTENGVTYSYNENTNTLYFTGEGIVNLSAIEFAFGDGANGCIRDIKVLNIGADITDIDLLVFDEMVYLETIQVVTGNTVYISLDGILYSKDKTTVIRYPINKTTNISYTIPSFVKVIGERAYAGNTALQTIKVQSSVTTINDAAFEIEGVTVTILGSPTVNGNMYGDPSISGRYDFSTVTVSGIEDSYSYTGLRITPEVVVTTADGIILSKDNDYSVKYSNNLNVGTATVTITGINSNYGTITKTFEITSFDIGDEITISYTNASKVVAGSENVIVKYGTTLLSSGTDYTIKTTTYDDETIIIVYLCGNYKGRKSLQLYDISSASVDGLEKSYGYNGSAIIPEFSLVYKEKALVNGANYTYTISNNTNIGIGKITVSGYGKYYGSFDINFDIVKTNASNFTIYGLTDMPYTGSEQIPAASVIYGSTYLIEGTDYEIEYKNNINAGTATVVVTGIGGYTGTLTDTYVIYQVEISTAKISGVKKSVKIGSDGSATLPNLKLKIGDVTLKEGTDYTVTYSNNTSNGVATVTITGIGNYTGTVLKSFKVTGAAASDSDSSSSTNSTASTKTNNSSSSSKLGSLLKKYTPDGSSYADLSKLVNDNLARLQLLQTTAEEKLNKQLEEANEKIKELEEENAEEDEADIKEPDFGNGVVNYEDVLNDFNYMESLGTQMPVDVLNQEQEEPEGKNKVPVIPAVLLLITLGGLAIVTIDKKIGKG